jgi:hypothetical protein
MLSNLSHPIRKWRFLIRMAVTAALLLGSLPVPEQVPSANGTGAQNPPANSLENSPQKASRPQTSTAKNDPNAEVTIQDSGTTFKLRVNLAQVHVVVRDAKGNPVGNLQQEDFQLYDQGKLQPISLFTVETRESRREKAEVAALTQTTGMELTNGSHAVLPDRFIAMFFDDKLQMQGIHFRKTDGRNLNNLTVATANGNFVVGVQKTLEMNLADATYQKLMQGGLTVKSRFDLKPGKYLVRRVVRDSEGSQMRRATEPL